MNLIMNILSPLIWGFLKGGLNEGWDKSKGHWTN